LQIQIHISLKQVPDNTSSCAALTTRVRAPLLRHLGAHLGHARLERISFLLLDLESVLELLGSGRRVFKGCGGGGELSRERRCALLECGGVLYVYIYIYIYIYISIHTHTHTHTHTHLYIYAIIYIPGLPAPAGARPGLAGS